MGGAEKLISEIAPRLRDLGHEVDVLVFNGKDTPFRQNLERKGIKVMSVDDGSRSPYYLGNLLKMIPIIHRYDIVHAHTTPAQIFSALSKTLGLSRVKLVTTEHSTNNHRRGKWIYKLTDRLMYGCYSHIICIAEPSKTNLQTQIGEHDNITIIENGIDVEHFHRAESINRESLGVNETDFVLTMVGRFVDAKDQDTIIRAMPFLSNDCKLVLVGIGERLQACRELSISLGVADRVIFAGIRTDIPQILHTSDVVLMSSHWEGLSLSSLEGMSVDRPFIASDVQGLREVVQGAGILFPEGDYQRLAYEISNLKTDKAYYQYIAGRCLERARLYDISITVKKYNEIYLNLFNV